MATANTKINVTLVLIIIIKFMAINDKAVLFIYFPRLSDIILSEEGGFISSASSCCWL